MDIYLLSHLNHASKRFKTRMILKMLSMLNIVKLSIICILKIVATISGFSKG